MRVGKASAQPPGPRFAVRRPPRRKSGRRRMGIMALVVLGAALLGGAIYWGWHTPAFAVTRIETGSYRFTSPAVLDSVLGRYLGRNLLSVGKADVARDMASLSWVKDLHIQRRLPGTLAVDFREWRPLAVIAQQDLEPGLRGGTWVLAENGEVLAFPEGMAVPALPTLVGCSLAGGAGPGHGRGGGLAAGDSVETATLLALFRSMDSVGLETVAPVDFVVVRPEGYAIVLEGGQGRLQVGREDFRSRLERYLAARSHIEPGLDVDLRFADRLTVRRSDNE